MKNDITEEEKQEILEENRERMYSLSEILGLHGRETLKAILRIAFIKRDMSIDEMENWQISQVAVQELEDIFKRRLFIVMLKRHTPGNQAYDPDFAERTDAITKALSKTPMVLEDKIRFLIRLWPTVEKREEHEQGEYMEKAKSEIAEILRKMEKE